MPCTERQRQPDAFVDTEAKHINGLCGTERRRQRDRSSRRPEDISRPAASHPCLGMTFRRSEKQTARLRATAIHLRSQHVRNRDHALAASGTGAPLTVAPAAKGGIVKARSSATEGSHAVRKERHRKNEDPPLAGRRICRCKVRGANRVAVKLCHGTELLQGWRPVVLSARQKIFHFACRTFRRQPDTRPRASRFGVTAMSASTFTRESGTRASFRPKITTTALDRQGEVHARSAPTGGRELGAYLSARSIRNTHERPATGRRVASARSAATPAISGGCQHGDNREIS